MEIFNQYNSQHVIKFYEIFIYFEDLLKVSEKYFFFSKNIISKAVLSLVMILTLATQSKILNYI